MGQISKTLHEADIDPVQWERNKKNNNNGTQRSHPKENILQYTIQVSIRSKTFLSLYQLLNNSSPRLNITLASNNAIGNVQQDLYFRATNKSKVFW